jgi:hypothetical protein
MHYFSRTALERVAIAGDSPVGERVVYVDAKSRAEHVEFCLKMGGPPSKPKYYLITDSEQVP